MRFRLLTPVAVLAGALAAAAPAGAADTRVIPAGVSSGLVDLSGLTVDQATARLGPALRGHVRAPVVVYVGGHRVTLTGRAARVRLDANRTARRALQAALRRPAPAPGQAPAPVVVEPAITHSRAAVRAFAAAARAKVARAPRDASVRITLRRIQRLRSRPGVSLDVRALAARIDGTLDNLGRPRTFRQPTVRVSPRITFGELAGAYGTVVTIDRANFTLRLFKRLKVARRYRIAVGMAGVDTPPGRYAIQNKAVNPTWHVPNSDWAGSLAGSTVPGGAPDNPLKARWLGIANGVGIHGTAEEWSIGSRASHGCIRMRVADVVGLYPRVPVGTPVLIR